MSDTTNKSLHGRGNIPGVVLLDQWGQPEGALGAGKSGSIAILQDDPKLTIEENLSNAAAELLGWNTDMTKAPANRELLVQDKNMRDVWAKFDPTWGKGRGAWFDRNDRMVLGVWCWRADGAVYIANRRPGITKIR